VATRPGMNNLIARVRWLLADNDTPFIFPDEKIQEFLDSNRADVRYLELDSIPTLIAGQNALFLDFYSPIGGDWEEDEVLQDGSFAVITPTTPDRLIGKWTFTTQPIYPIFVVGKRYDLNGAAADLLELWASQLKLKFNFSTNQKKFDLQRQMQAVLEMATTYRAKSWPKVQRMVRDDLANY